MNIITDTLDEIRKMRVRKVIEVYDNCFAATPLRIKFRYDCLLCSYDLENTDGSYKHRESSCRSFEVNNSLIQRYSGSMEPSYYRGDILFLMRREEIIPGDIIVY